MGLGLNWYVISTNCSIQSVIKNFRIFSVIRHANAVGQKRVDRRKDKGKYVNGQPVTRDMRMHGRTDTVGTCDWTDGNYRTDIRIDGNVTGQTDKKRRERAVGQTLTCERTFRWTKTRVRRVEYMETFQRTVG